MVPDPAGLQLRARPLCTSRAVTLQLGKQVAAAILVVAALAHEAAAQQQPPVQVEQRSPRKLVYAIAGAVGGALAGSVFANLASLKDGVTPVVATAAGGAVLGYFLGRQQDRLHALRFRGVAPLRVESRRVELPGSPVALAVRRGRAAVGLSTGFAVVDASGALRVEAERARTLAGVAGVAIADDTGSILLAAGSGAYRFPPTGGGVLLRDGPAWAVAAAPDAYYIAVGDRVERAPSGADTSRVWPGGVRRRRRVRSLRPRSRRRAADPARARARPRLRHTPRRRRGIRVRPRPQPQRAAPHHAALLTSSRPPT